MRKQYSIELIAGSDKLSNAFRNECIHELSALCGGVTVLTSYGTWYDEAGETRKEEYGGKLNLEATLHVLMTCEENKLKKVIDKVKEIVKYKVTEHNQNVHWVHCKVSESFGCHFNVDK